MDEVQVQIVELKALHGALKGRQRAVVAVFLNPQFRGDNSSLAGDAAPLDPSTNGGLVEIGRGRVNQAITRVNGVDHTLFACGCIGDLEYAEAKKGHCNAIVQCHLLHEGLQVRVHSHADP